MWFESQNCAMMGVQVTAGKRKLETGATAGDDLQSPAKTGRWEPPAGGGGGAIAGTGPTDDCIARLQAVAVPVDAWRPTPTATPPPSTTSLTSPTSDDFDDDDDFDDELSDDDRIAVAPETLRYHQTSLTTYDYHQSANSNHSHNNSSRGATAGGYYYYTPPVQQKILCEENGKSYLELGAAPIQPPVRTRCCDGRTRWCNVPCYRQRRLAVLNLSMCKLARYRQCSDPSLRRSVLICNTLRHIEREMEAEGQQPAGPPGPPPPPPEAPCFTPSSFSECTPLTPITPQPQRLTSMQPLDPYEHNLRDFATPSGRATPFPSSSTDTDSGIGDEDSGKSINWGSVLSLTSQTDLEPLNNNEFYAELGLGAPNGDIATSQEWNKEFPQQRTDGEWDNFMHVLVGGS